MRLFLALLAATLVATLVLYVQHVTAPQTGIKMGSEHVEFRDADHGIAADGKKGGSSINDTPSFQTLVLKAFNSVIAWVLLGWAAVRLARQFWHVIVAFIGLLVIVDFILVQMNLISFDVRWDEIEAGFRSVVALVVNLGFVKCFSFIIGVWSGMRGYVLRREKIVQRNMHNNFSQRSKP